MAATVRTKIIFTVEGLNEPVEATANFATTTTCTVGQKIDNGVQTTADTAEAIPLGKVTTPELIVFHCIENDCDIDTSYVSSFSAEIPCAEGEWRVFKPEGTVYIKNHDAGEKVTYECWIYGT